MNTSVESISHEEKDQNRCLARVYREILNWTVEPVDEEEIAVAESSPKSPEAAITAESENSTAFELYQKFSNSEFNHHPLISRS